MNRREMLAVVPAMLLPVAVVAAARKPKYSVRPEDHPGSVALPAELYPCEVYDGAGVKVQFCTMADLETGEVEHYVTDNSGFVILRQEDSAEVRGGVLYVREMRPLPLKLVLIPRHR